MTIETSVDIDADVLAVWRVVRDVERWPRWTPSMTSVQRLDDDGPLDVGSRVRIKQPGMPAMVWTVTALTPTAGFTWTTRSPGVTAVASHELTALPGGSTRLRLAVSESGPLSGLVARLARRRGTRFVQQEADGLKAAAERAVAA